MRAWKPVENERGLAVVTCIIFVLAFLVGVTAAVHRMGQADVNMARNYRSANQGLYAAEAGIKHAVAMINEAGVIDLKSDVIDKWPNAQAPFAASPNPMARQTSFAYQVTILEDDLYPPDPMLPRERNRALLTADGTGADDTLRTVFARIVRSGVPNAPPGAIYLATDSPTDARFNGNAFLVDGNDKYDGVQGPKLPVPGITTRNEANAEETRDSLNDVQKSNVQGLGYIAGPPPTPSVEPGAGPTAAQISQMIDDLLALPGVDTASCSANDGKINGSVVFGTVPAPQITYCNNHDGTTIRGNGNATGVGILIVERALVINGTLDFKGLILVRGTTEVTEVTGHAYVQGSLWTTDFNLTVGGSAVVQYSSQALALANQSGGGTGALPAPVVISAWRDEF